MEVVRNISSDAGVRNSVLVQMLREEGVRVAWERPDERRGIEYANDVQQVASILVATGTVTAIQAGVARFRAKYRSAHVTVESDVADQQGSEPFYSNKASKEPGGTAEGADSKVPG